MTQSIFMKSIFCALILVTTTFAATAQTVTYDGNTNTGGAVPVDASTYIIDDTVTVLGNTGALVKTGYTFNDWNTAANGSGTTYAADATFAMGSASVTLYAQWTAINYSVTYDGNTNTGGAVPVDGSTYNITDTVTVLGNTGALVKTGYTFNDWNTAANGSGTTYAAAATFAMGSASVTLYAQWAAINYSVTYDGNTNTGGAVPVDGSTYNITDTVTVLGNTGALVKTGYTFNDWNTAANGSGTTYAAAATFAMGSVDVTLYAQWSIISYTVTFNGNTNDGGTTAAQASNYNVAANLTANGFTKTGYTFTGWNTIAIGGGTAYADGASYAFTADVTLYAQWAATTQTVTYALGGGTGTLPTQADVITDATFTVATGAGLTRTGYTFNGWHDGTSAYAASSTYTMAAVNVTLTAQWTALNNTVTYDGNTNTGGAVPVDGSTYNITDTVTVLGNTGALVKTGYTFNDWNTAANGSGTTYAAAATFAMGSVDVTLYAQWTATTQTVTYALGGGTGTLPTQADVITDATFTVATGAGLTRTGYTFNGWHDGTSAYAASSTYTMAAVNVTLTAQWTAALQTVTYALGGGTGTLPTQVNIATGGTFTIATDAGLTRAGYTFIGWYDGISTYAASSTYTMGAANVTLTAQWIAINYTVIYNGNTNTGGTAPDDVSTYITGGMVTVLDNTGALVKTDYTFNGWNTATDGTGIQYAAAATFAMGSANVILYARWALIPMPTVVGISPTSGTSTGGTSVTIIGTNFTGASAVTIGGTSATGISVVNATTITAVTPAGAAGAQNVVVATPGGTGTGISLFTYITVPDAPIIGTAFGELAQVTVSFTAPASDGGSTITGYTATSSPDGLTSSGCTTSPCTVTGLTGGIAYTFTVTATNGVGTSVASAASNSASLDSPPVITPPADVTVNAIGLFTPVSIGTATASDSSDGALTPTSNASSHYSPGVHTVTWSVTDTGANTTTANQTINVIPLVGFSGDQAAREGNTVSFKVILNGDAVTYPVTLPYTVSGTATTIIDHDLIDGSVDIFAANVEAIITVNLVNDGFAEGDETIVVTLGVPINAVKGVADKHTIVISETNLAPQISLSAIQVSEKTFLISQSGGSVFVTATVSDSAGDTQSYDWTATDNALIDSDAVAETFTFDPSGLAPAFYTVRVAVSDGSAISYAEILLNVVATAPTLTAIDSDGDGVNDDVEGFADTDGDGIANYLDNSGLASNVALEQTGITDRFLMETESGLVASLGSVAFRAGVNATGVTMSKIEIHANDGAGVATEAGFNYNSGLFDFNVSNLPVAGQSVRVVVAQFAVIPAYAIYRNLTQTGWQTFAEDVDNLIASTAGVAGYCPPPGDIAYQPGLTEGDLCVQLTIVDGGLNDADGVVNNRVANVGGVTRRISGSSDNFFGVGSLHPLWLLILGLLPLHRSMRKRKQD